MPQISPSTAARLDRAAWHRPLVSVIITHFNYSLHVRDALLSLLDQTHDNWECVIVDDVSAPEHRERLREIVSALGCSKVTIVWQGENGGQLLAFFAGLDATRGEFVCPLDPDDRYAETFLAEALAAHLNQTVVCPMVCTDQYTLVNGEVTTAVQARHRLKQLIGRARNAPICIDSQEPHLLFLPAKLQGWHWTSTSSFMFRRAALQYLRPHKPPSSKIYADGYLARGLHLIGGSLFLMKPLVYRTLHESNSLISKNIFSSLQQKNRLGAPVSTDPRHDDLIEALRRNHAPLLATLTEKKKGVIARWHRSLAKRFPHVFDV